MIEYLLSLSLLILAVLLIRGIFRRAVFPRIVYALWLVVVIRMLVPITFFEIGVTLPEFLQNEQTEQTEHSEQLQADSQTVPDTQEQSPTTAPIQTVPTYPSQDTPPVTSIVPTGPIETTPLQPIMPENDPPKPDTDISEIPIPDVPEKTGAVNWMRIANVVWFCGAVLATAWYIYILAVYKKRVAKGCRLHRTVRGTKVYISEGAGVPCVAGFIPSIYITPEAANSKSEMLIIIHEYIHIRHFDHIWSFVRALALIVFWWNPLVWIAATVSKQDSELACDDTISSKLSDDGRLKYANILIDTIPQKHRYAVGLGSAPIKERILMLTKKHRNSLICLILAVLLAVSAVGCAFTSFTEKDDKNLSDDKVGIITENLSDFLTEEQIALYEKAGVIYPLFNGNSDSINILHLLLEGASFEEQTNYIVAHQNEDDEMHKIDRTTYRPSYGEYDTFDEFKSLCLSVFTEEYFGLLNKADPYSAFIDHNNKLYYIDAAKGSAFGYAPDEFPDKYELVEMSDEVIVFKIIGHYKSSNVDPDFTLTQETFTVKMVLTENGWRFSKFAYAGLDEPIITTNKSTVYTRYGINVVLPEAYLSDAVTYVPENELPDNFIAEFYQTAIMDDNAGWLFTIARHSEGELLSEKTNHAGFNYFAHDSEYWYGVMVPTDVQLDLTSEELTKEYQDLFAQKDLVVQAILEANSLLTPASNEDAYKRYSEIHLTTQGPFVGYVASKDTPWIDLYTEVNGTWVAKIPYEIFHDWTATDRTHETWKPGWMSEYTCFYYAEFGDFRWAAVHLGDTVLGVGRKNVATSTDGGQTWSFGSTRDYYGGNHVVGIGFASENVAFMSFDPHNEFDGADGPVISRTVDGGKTWELLDIPVPPSLKGKKLIAGIPYYSRNELFYPVWLNTSHGEKEGEPMYLVSRDKGLTWSWDRYSLPAEMTQYVVDIPMEDERDFITVAGVYGKGAEPGYPDGATIHAGKDGTLYFVMGVGNDWWSRGNFKALRTYRVTSRSGYLESVEEVETFTKNKVLNNGKPYTGELDGMFTCQAYRFIQGNFNYDFWSHSIYIQSDGSIFANVGMVGTGGPINYEGTYQYDENTGDFTAKLVGRYASNGEVDIYPESEVKGKLYEYGGFVHFVCESSEVSTLTVNDPIPLTFVPNTDGYADPPTLVLDNEFDGVWESCFGNSSGDYLYRLSIVTETAQIQFDDIKNDSSYVGTYTVNPLNHTQTATLRSLNASAKEDEFTIKFSLGYVKGEGETWLYFDVRACDAPSLQHIVGYTLVFEDNTAISTAYTTESIFSSILENKQSFYDVSSKESMLLSEYKAKTDYSIKRYAILDLNKDRDPEMVLWLGYYENDYLGFLVLHRDGDTVYAHDFPYRGMNGLRRDGDYISSTSAFNMSIVRLDFSGDTYTENVLARREGDGSLESIRHYIGEKEVTKQEFLEYYDRYDSSGIPDWYSYDIEEITDIDDWDSLIWAEGLPEDENKHPSQQVYSFIRKLVKGEANIPELNGLGIKDYSIAILKNSSFDSQIRFNFTVTGNSLPETLPPGTYSWRLLDGMDLYIYRDEGPGETVNTGRAHGLNRFGEYSAAQAVDTYLCWMPYIWEVSPYGEWDMTNYNLPYNYICAHYGENLEIGFEELQRLMAEKFGITVERPADGVLHSWRCEYNKANDTIGYADTRGYEPVHEIIDVREDGDVTYVTVQLFADRLYLVPSHKVVYQIGEGDVFLGYEIAETGKYEPREFELNGGGDY